MAQVVPIPTNKFSTPNENVNKSTSSTVVISIDWEYSKTDDVLRNGSFGPKKEIQII